MDISYLQQLVDCALRSGDVSPDGGLQLEARHPDWDMPSPLPASLLQHLLRKGSDATSIDGLPPRLLAALPMESLQILLDRL